ncbi:MAG TPA: DUF4166 domain-containing protein, partial [Tabrizicola sp.]|nr:DUF4166 domain-containing protein [Tabrizicola sp.]
DLGAAGLEVAAHRHPAGAGRRTGRRGGARPPRSPGRHRHPRPPLPGVLGRRRRGARAAPGARAGIGALTLKDYESVFAGRTILTGWREGIEPEPYPQTLGPVFHDLPPLLQKLHRPGARSVWRGRADVSRGKGPFAALVAAFFGFPKPGKDQPVEVTFTTDSQGRETWIRNFGGRKMRSTQASG